MRFLWSLAMLLLPCADARAEITVGSKVFTESYILAEIAAQVVDRIGESRATRRFGLGGTGILYQSITTGAVDLYPEYTGTISEAIIKEPSAKSWDEIARRLAGLGLVMTKPLGFNNTYALAVRGDLAEKQRLETISDLGRVPEIRAGFSNEFMTRADGLPGLRQSYGLSFSTARSMEHSLTYGALAAQEIDLTDVYSTDAKIAKLGLRVLRDDRAFFPTYWAVFLARKEFVERHPQTWEALRGLEGALPEREMIRLNGLVDLEKRSFAEAARDHLKEKGSSPARKADSVFLSIWERTREHLILVFVALAFSLVAGLPLGIIASRHPWLGHFILAVSGLLQTVPSLALLCFLIPVLGIGIKPALGALFLYGLLPIVVGVYTGLQGIDQRLIESSRALGLAPSERLRLIELPLASPSILGGVRTSVVISIGTATLAALIGAGGYGVPIVTGLAINDIPTVLQGAIPAALLALVVHAGFEVAHRYIIPGGLRRH